MHDPKKPPASRFLALAAQLGLGSFLLALFLFLLLFQQDYRWSVIWDYRWFFLQGWEMTVIISSISLVSSVLIGMLCALCYRAPNVLLHCLAKAYVEIIRGTPLLVQILFFYYVVANAVGIDNRYMAGVAILSIFSGAYIAEIIRSGIEGIAKTQLQSALAIGLTTFQTYRFIIFPQAFRQILPPLAGQFASIIKDSSLLSIIGINELTNNAQQINSATYSTLESYLPLALGYLVLTLPISIASKRLEKRFLYET